MPIDVSKRTQVARAYRRAMEEQRERQPWEVRAFVKAAWAAADEFNLKYPLDSPAIHEMRKLFESVRMRAKLAEQQVDWLESRIRTTIDDPRRGWRYVEEMAPEDDREVATAMRQWKWWMDRALGLIDRSAKREEDDDERDGENEE